MKVIQLVRNEEIAAFSGRKDQAPKAAKPQAITQDPVFAARAEIGRIHVSDAIERYMGASPVGGRIVS